VPDVNSAGRLRVGADLRKGDFGSKKEDMMFGVISLRVEGDHSGPSLLLLTITLFTPVKKSGLAPLCKI